MVDKDYYSWIFCHRPWHVSPCCLEVNWSFNICHSPGKGEGQIVSAVDYPACLRKACGLVEDKNALLLQVRSMEEVDYSAYGMSDYYFARDVWGEVVINGSWLICEQEKSIPSGANYFLSFVNGSLQASGGTSDVGDYWYSRYFVFGQDIGNIVSLSNIRYVRRLADKFGVTITPLKLFELNKFKPGEDIPPLVLARDAFETFGLLFHQEKLKDKYPY